MDDTLHRPAGCLAAGPYELSLTPGQAGWAYAGLRVLALPAGGWHELSTGDEEMLVLPLAGSATVDCAGQRFELAGRPSVFAGVTDFVYLPPGAAARIGSAAGGRFALPSACITSARITSALIPGAGAAGSGAQARYGAAAAVPVELRGAGSCSRQVNGFCMPGTFPASRLLACEVLTPAGNWSSYPPHKHDQDRPGETVLEEIYYFEIAAGPPDPAGVGQRPGVGFQRVYGTADRPADLLAEVRTGDVVLIPHGWHGPSMAAPGYDMYYLNVMAGPGPERAWLICDDPAHAWVRDSWAGQRPDPRLPFQSTP
jgi:5-deoxy-glucuronate isomerase